MNLARHAMLTAGLLLAVGSAAIAAPRPLNIMITGYWPPTNEMLRQWSTSPTQNPGGWTGQNWEGRGYHLYSFFPEFPGMSEPSYGKGVGDFEVDYQDTIADFNRIVAEVKPIAIVSFSRASTVRGWECEPAYQRWRVVSTETVPAGRTIGLYSSDYLAPTRPDDASVTVDPVGTMFLSTLPQQQIVDAIAAAIPSTTISPFIAAYNPATPNSYDYSGSFLSGFMPYLAARYRFNHADPSTALYCAMSGHIHVGGSGLYNQIPACKQAAEITLREVITALNGVVPIQRCQAADIATDAGDALSATNRGAPNGGVNEGDYNCFFIGFFDASPACDIAYDNAEPLPPFGTVGGTNGGVNEGDYNCFFMNFFSGC